MKTYLPLLKLPFFVTVAVLILRLAADITGLPGASVLNISWLIPVFAVYLGYKCLRLEMGYGGFLGAVMLYTLTVGVAVILVMVLTRAAGVETAYFAFRSVLFSLILPHLILTPVAAFIIGTLVWPVMALFIRGRQASYRGVTGAVAVILIIVFIGVPYAISRLYTGGLARRSFQQTPQAFGVAYEDVTLTTADGLNIRGWHIPREQARGAVIFCHGLFNQRAELLEQAVFMHEQGYQALLFDFRHHGESDGEYTTFGYFEKQDVEAALQYIKERQGEEQPVILWGISMGAANALLTAAAHTSVSGVIAESSFYSVDETLRQDLGRMFRLPAVPFAYLVEAITEIRLGIRIDDLNIGNAVSRIHDRPILLVGGTADRRMPIHINTRLFDAIPGDRKHQFAVTGAGHADAWRMATDIYKEEVRQFLNTYFEMPGADHDPTRP